jgi:hypothetical protein
LLGIIFAGEVRSRETAEKNPNDASSPRHAWRCEVAMAMATTIERMFVSFLFAALQDAGTPDNEPQLSLEGGLQDRRKPELGRTSWLDDIDLERGGRIFRGKKNLLAWRVVAWKMAELCGCAYAYVLLRGLAESEGQCDARQGSAKRRLVA